jgi:5'-3' exoribonuclease 1
LRRNLLQYFAQDKEESEMFKALAKDQSGEAYYPLHDVAKIVGLPSKVVSKLTSRVMAVDSDRSGKVNLGLSVKFEAKAQKVIDYSRKTDRYWEFSQVAVDLIKKYKVTCANPSYAGSSSLARAGKIPRGHEAP